MSEWLKLDRRTLNKPSRKSIRGADVTVFLSPYDVPEAVRGDVDEATGRFVIQLKYLGNPATPNEPLDTESEEGPLVLKVGRHSHRLYRVELDLAALGVDQVQVRFFQELDEAINRLSSRRRRPQNRGHYDVAQQALSERGSDLLRELVASSE